jgi:hypothetical protein
MAQALKDQLEQLGFKYKMIALQMRNSASYEHERLPFSIFLAEDAHSWGSRFEAFARYCPQGKRGVVRITLDYFDGKAPPMLEDLLPVLEVFETLVPQARIFFDGQGWKALSFKVPTFEEALRGAKLFQKVA